ncbi:hypothetical protein B0H19DRAFT_1168284 [Mycena capillaripes]|nr:hypothetical protein B0H19DRAFT_1168284 [Mycena capillaripes]
MWDFYLFRYRHYFWKMWAYICLPYSLSFGFNPELFQLYQWCCLGYWFQRKSPVHFRCIWLLGDHDGNLVGQQ